MYTCLNKNSKIMVSNRVAFGSNVIFGKNCNTVEIGYGSFIGSDIYIDVPLIKIGDYTTIHRGGTIHGYNSCFIGHNCWIGQYTIIDCIGGANIGNNVGIGAHSQLWSHIKFGDMLEGCLWNTTKSLNIEDDVWFVGHCIVSPINAKRKSMLMVGGVATKDMEENHVYAGVPAKDVTSHLGNQFEEKSLNSKIIQFENLYMDFITSNKIKNKDFCIKIVDNLNNVQSTNNVTYFNLTDRTYCPSRSANEYKFMKYLLYDKAKFIPIK